jgi:hypothetical protein
MDAGGAAAALTRAPAVASTAGRGHEAAGGDPRVRVTGHEHARLDGITPVICTRRTWVSPCAVRSASHGQSRSIITARACGACGRATRCDRTSQPPSNHRALLWPPAPHRANKASGAAAQHACNARQHQHASHRQVERARHDAAEVARRRGRDFGAGRVKALIGVAGFARGQGPTFGMRWGALAPASDPLDRVPVQHRLHGGRATATSATTAARCWATTDDRPQTKNVPGDRWRPVLRSCSTKARAPTLRARTPPPSPAWPRPAAAAGVVDSC